MELCQLRLVNESNVLVDCVDFLSYPFGQPLNLKIPKATKRLQETGDSMFRDGGEITNIRYNNAVITLQPLIKFEADDRDAALKLSELKSRIDRIFEYARRLSIYSYGMRVEFWEDSSGVKLSSLIIDGSFDVEDPLDFQIISSGGVSNCIITMTRTPFRTAVKSEKLENFVLNPGFEELTAGVPDEWAVTNGTLGNSTTQIVEGKYSATLACVISGINDTYILGTAITLTAGTVYYLEAWARVFSGDPLVMEIYRVSTGTPLAMSASFTTGDWNTIVYGNERAVRGRKSNFWDRDTDNLISPSLLMRKGFTFTPPATETYQVRFRVITPIAIGDYKIDRVYLTEAANLPEPVVSDQVFDPASVIDKDQMDSIISHFPYGWISSRDILNHYDDGTTNHGDGNTGFHTNYVDVLDIPGDTGAFTRIRIENRTGSTLRQLFASMRTFGSPSYQVTTQEVGVVADAACSQGNRLNIAAVGASFAALTGATATMTHETNTRRNISGNWRVLVRMRDLAAVQGNLRLYAAFRLMTNNGEAYNVPVIAPGPGAANFFICDIGGMTVPQVSPDATTLTSFSGMTLNTFGMRTTGADAADLDYYLIMCADEYYCAVSPTWANGQFMNLMSIPGYPSAFLESWVSSIDIRMLEIPGGTADKPYLYPERQNRIVFATARANAQHVINDPVRVSVTYYGRYL